MTALHAIYTWSWRLSLQYIQIYCTLALVNHSPSSETQRQSVGPEEKAWRKFSSTSGRAPGYRLSQDHFQTVKRMLAPDWAQKCFVLLCPIGEQFLLSSFREFVHDGYYLATVARFVHQAFLTRQRNYRWVEKRFGCYQQEQFNLHWENSVSDGSQCIVNNRKFKMRRRWTRSQKRAIAWLTRQNDNFARASLFVVHFFAVTVGLPRENA